MDIMKTIQEVMTERGVSLRKVSRDTGMPLSTVHRAAGPSGNPQLDTLRKIARAMRLRTWSLVRMLGEEE